MRIQLNEEQVLFIESKLEELGLNYAPLQDEVLDHFCCLAEDELEKGKTFQQATSTIFEIFGKDELKRLQEQTISLTHQKSSRMKNIVFAFFTSFVVLGVLFFFPREEKIKVKKVNSSPCSHKVTSQPFQSNESVKTAFEIFDEPPSMHPLNGNFKMTSGFGQRMHPIYKKKKMHTGVDFRAPMGTDVVATSDGVIIKATYHKKHGNYIIVQHDDEYKTKYSHLSKLKVKEGDSVKKGNVIGLVGNSGMSTLPHLHYEVIKNGKKVNPKDYYTP